MSPPSRGRGGGSADNSTQLVYLKNALVSWVTQWLVTVASESACCQPCAPCSSYHSKMTSASRQPWQMKLVCLMAYNQLEWGCFPLCVDSHPLHALLGGGGLLAKALQLLAFPHFCPRRANKGANGNHVSQG